MQRLVLSMGIVSTLIAVLQCQSLAQPRSSSCVIAQSRSGELVANNSGLSTKLESYPNDALVVVKCGGNNRGNPAITAISKGFLRLSIEQSATYNGSVQFRLVRGSGIFGNLPTGEYGTAPIVVPYSFNGTLPEGQVFYQVRVVATDRNPLQAARDYSVSVRVALYKG